MSNRLSSPANSCIRDVAGGGWQGSRAVVKVASKQVAPWLGSGSVQSGQDAPLMESIKQRAHSHAHNQGYMGVWHAVKAARTDSDRHSSCGLTSDLLNLSHLLLPEELQLSAVLCLCLLELQLGLLKLLLLRILLLLGLNAQEARNRFRAGGNAQTKAKESEGTGGGRFQMYSDNVDLSCDSPGHSSTTAMELGIDPCLWVKWSAMQKK